LRRLAEKAARLLALIGMIAALLTPAVPGFAAAAPAQPRVLHAAMDCGDAATDTHQRQVPPHHAPGAVDCCVANICAMNLALPAASSAVERSALAAGGAYDLRPLQQPLGVETAPIPHPPKAAA